MQMLIPQEGNQEKDEHRPMNWEKLLAEAPGVGAPRRGKNLMYKEQNNDREEVSPKHLLPMIKLFGSKLGSRRLRGARHRSRHRPLPPLRVGALRQACQGA